MSRVIHLPLAAAVLAVLLLAGCGGSSSSDRWTAQQVVKTVQAQINTSLSFDANRESSKLSVLTDRTDQAGPYGIWVFKSGYDSTNFTIANIQVPDAGAVQWGNWQSLDPKLTPCQGYRYVLRSYGNVVLEYQIATPPNGKRPALPGGFQLLDSALTHLPGFKGGAAGSAPTRGPPQSQFGASTGDVRTVILRQCDLPAGFKQLSASYVSNAQAAAEDSKPSNYYVNLGRIDGYSAEFAKGSSLAYVDILAAANVYSTDADAHRSYLAQGRSLKNVITLAVPASAASLGPDVRFVASAGTYLALEKKWRAALAAGAVFTQGQLAEYHQALQDDLPIYSLQWRTGTVKTTITVTGLSATATATVVATALKEQARIQSALRP